MKTKLCAYTVVERNGQKFWVRIGEAHEVQPDQITVTLDALPVNGVLVLRPIRQGLTGMFPTPIEPPEEVIPARLPPIPPAVPTTWPAGQSLPPAPAPKKRR